LITGAKPSGIGPISVLHSQGTTQYGTFGALSASYNNGGGYTNLPPGTSDENISNSIRHSLGSASRLVRGAGVPAT